jgi:lysophospholipase L1-like esterase
MKKLLGFSLFFNAIFFGCIVFALVKIGSPRYLFQLVKYRGNGIVSLKRSKTSHLNTLPITEGKIIMLGNSITAECQWAELMQNPDIINRGVIGDGTGDILERIDPIIAAKPKKVFLLIGVNDLMYLPLSKIKEYYEKIVSRIITETPTTQLYLESILPIHNDLRRNGMKNEDINMLNTFIEQLSQKYHLTYIDLSSKFKNTEGSIQQKFSLDGIHLNGEGYLLLKNIVQPIINQQ